jgi:hypothetical protein
MQAINRQTHEIADKVTKPAENGIQAKYDNDNVYGINGGSLSLSPSLVTVD